MDFDILVILSGVELQRISLEQALKEKLVRQKQRRSSCKEKQPFTKTEEGPITTVSYFKYKRFISGNAKTKAYFVARIFYRNGLIAVGKKLF